MPFSPKFHIVFDLLAFLVGSVLFRRELRNVNSASDIQTKNGYWVSLVGGAVVGAYGAGSLNLSLAGFLRIGHSIAGALAGGIVGVELFKIGQKERASTGYVFVVPIMAGIVIGRLGCFFAGLADETYGIPTSSFLGVDFGDGIPRHPVQLYEALAVLIGLIALLMWRRRSLRAFQSYGFYVFILIYAGQRFFLEFLKPYPQVIGGLNIFHFICAAMMTYAALMIGLTNAKHA